MQRCLENVELAQQVETLRLVYLTRFMDEKCFRLSRQNKGGTFQLSVAGHELAGVVAAQSLRPMVDWGLPYYRDRGFVVGLGADITELMGAFMARDVPHHSGGRMMPEHFVHKALKIPCQSSCVGSQFLHAVGVAKGLQIQRREEVVYVSAGDGASSQGDFHEALNFSALHKLGVIFSIQDNGLAISVPQCEQTAGGSLASIFSSYEGLWVQEVDGCDYIALKEAFAKAALLARTDQGPSLIVSKVPRMGPHSNSDDPAKYLSAEQMQEALQKDPILRLEKDLLEQGIAKEVLEQLKQTCFKQVEEATIEAEKYPFPEASQAHQKVFKKQEEVQKISASSSAESVVMVDALNHALDEAMKEDPGVIVFGEDVAHGKGGVFGVTRSLTAKYGQERCFNTPLAESTIIGIAVGMSLVEGLKPVAEIQFADYIWPGINQLFNELASFHYRSNGEWNCPVVIRMPYGGYIQGGPYHSQSIEGFLAHCPGLKVVIPSNAADAKRLLKAAIQDPNPVVFLEHKALYRQRLFCARKEPGDQDIELIGKASILKEGKDITLITWGMMTFMAHDLVEKLGEEGIDIELIDLRTIVPLDIELILQSVRKTGKVLIAHEAPKSSGFGAEIASRIAEEAFAFLDAPIMRLGGQDCPVPYCTALENVVLPQRHNLESLLRKLADF